MIRVRVVEAPADDLWAAAQPVGRCLQRRYVVDGAESVILLAKADLVPLQLLFDELWPLSQYVVWKGKKEATRMTIGPRTSSRT